MGKINEGDLFWTGLSFVWVILYLWDGLLVSDKEIIVERVYSMSLECMCNARFIILRAINNTVRTLSVDNDLQLAPLF